MLNSLLNKITMKKLLTIPLLWLSLQVPAQLIKEISGSKLLTTSIRTGDTEVFIIDPVTGDAFNVTKAPDSEERYPIWMPDGKRVVFTSNRDDVKTFNLYIANADGTSVKRLTNETGGAVYYFPSVQADGQKIWFSMAKDDKAIIGYVSTDGKEYKEVADGRDGAISPNGKHVAFTKKLSKGFPVSMMDADGKNQKQITTHEDEIGAVAPTWSTDGKKLLYADQVDEFLEVFSCDADGNNQKQLTNLKKISSSAAWSPDGRFITFRVTDFAYWRDSKTQSKTYQEKLGDKRPVYIMKADGSDVQLLETLHYHCAMDGSRAAWKPK
jgi:TolB protein